MPFLYLEMMYKFTETLGIVLTGLLNNDLDKTFDSLWVEGLLFTLLEHSISDRMYQIIELLLKNRAASDEMNEHQDPRIQITTSVPQRSVLSPLLFIIVLNDLLRNSTLRVIVTSLTLGKTHKICLPIFEKFLSHERETANLAGTPNQSRRPKTETP